MFRFRTFMPILLAYAIVAPALVKLEHHHNNFICHAKQEKHFHTYSGTCYACNFEFSVFSASERGVQKDKIRHTGFYRTVATSPDITSLYAYTFLLRAPPVV